MEEKAKEYAVPDMVDCFGAVREALQWTQPVPTKESEQ